MGRGNRPHALCRGRCGWRAARACTSCQLDTPLPSRLFLRVQAGADHAWAIRRAHKQAPMKVLSACPCLSATTGNG